MQFYKITCKPSGGLVLDRTSEQRVVSTLPPFWKKEPVALRNGLPIQLWGGGGAANQQWGLIPTDGPYVRIVLREEETFHLDAEQANVDRDGCKVQVWSFPGGGEIGANAQWKIEDAGNGFVFISNRASGRLLNAELPDVQKEGCKVQLWARTGGENEIWRLEAVP